MTHLPDRDGRNEEHEPLWAVEPPEPAWEDPTPEPQARAWFSVAERRLGLPARVATRAAGLIAVGALMTTGVAIAAFADDGTGSTGDRPYCSESVTTDCVDKEKEKEKAEAEEQKAAEPAPAEESAPAEEPAAEPAAEPDPPAASSEESTPAEEPAGSSEEDAPASDPETADPAPTDDAPANDSPSAGSDDAPASDDGTDPAGSRRWHRDARPGRPGSGLARHQPAAAGTRRHDADHRRHGEPR